MRERGPIYSLRWSRGYSNATLAICVSILLHPWMQPTSNRHKPMHGCAPNCAFLHVSKGEAVWWKWAIGRWPWESVDSGFHSFLIIGPWLASKGGCRSGTWVSLVRKAISKLVEASKWMTVDPGIQGSSTSTFGSNRLKPMVDGHTWGCHLALPWISDMEGPGGASANTMWRRAMPLGGPWPS